jgi:hypothetical protein
MNTGDRVRILAGRGAGHEGIVAGHNGSSVAVKVAAMDNTMAGGAMISVRRKNLEVLRAQTVSNLPNFRPYVPPRWSVPREGSDRASRLPSVAGGRLLWPAGIR